MASGAEVISTKFFYAFGYNTPENYIATLRRESLVIGTDDADRRRRRQAHVMEERDLRGAAQEGGAPGRRHLSRPRQQGAARDAARALPLLRHAARRSERHLPARASPRAARPVGVRRLAESRRLAQHQHARHPGPGRRPLDDQALPARLRLDARQRQHAGADDARRQRVPLGSAADDGHDADARVLRAAVGQGGLSGHAGGRPASKRPTSVPRSGSRSIRIRRSPTPVPRIASGRPASLRRSPTRRSRRIVATREVHRPARDRVHDRDDPRAEGEGADVVAERHQPGGRFRPRDRTDA